jgi:transcriptional regulator with XRE-family HTH domain
MTIGERLQQLRKHLRLTQEDLGAICDVSKGMVSQWEGDISVPTVERLLALHTRHRFSIDWVLTGDGDMIQTGLYVAEPRIAAIAATLLHAKEDGQDYLIENTQKSLAASTELAAQATAHAKAKDC